MRTRAKRRVTARFTWDLLMVSFWFAPLVMFVAAFVYCISAATSLPPATVQPERPQRTATIGLLAK